MNKIREFLKKIINSRIINWGVKGVKSIILIGKTIIIGILLILFIFFKFFKEIYKKVFAKKIQQEIIEDEIDTVSEQLKLKLKSQKELKTENLNECSDSEPEISNQIESIEIIPNKKLYLKEELFALEKKEIHPSLKYTKNYYILGVSISGKEHSIPKVINDEPTYIPCQDYHKIDSINNYNIIICCDGAGSAINSHIGSNFIADSITIELKKVFSKNITFSKQEWNELMIEIFYRIRNKLKQFSIENNIIFETLASTINVTIFDKNNIYYSHIGDGRSCYLTDKWYSIMTPWKGNEANSTVFITSSIWNDPNSYIISDIIKTDIDIQAVSVLTDGCETHTYTINKQVDNRIVSCNEPFVNVFDHFYTTIKNVKKESNNDKLLNTWIEFIDAGNDKIQNELDDKTMIIAILQ